ncbi:MAG: proline--tRNA ligase, partial [Acidobacteriaceae bacterium]|nr:proline--tRNA ligase [Acidobacteriaceae bacterium]
AGLDVSYKKHYDAYCRIFDRCGLKYAIIEAHSGSMGGTESHEFAVRAAAGEDKLVSCDNCHYAANLEKATSKVDPVQDLAPEGDGKPLEIYTPGKGAIADIAEFLKISPKQDIKVVAYMARKVASRAMAEKVLDPSRSVESAEIPVAVFLRGDHTVNEVKLLTVLGAGDLRPMHPEEVQKYFSGPGGFIGPVGLKVRQSLSKEAITESDSVVTVLDKALEGRANMICGANKLDYHFKNVTPGRDFRYTVDADIRNVEAGEGCPKCGSPLRIDAAVEIGHIFKLGYKYSESMGARVLDRNGKEITPIMGSYGIGIERILTAAVEQSNDQNGFWLPPQIAPFAIVVTPTNVSDEKLLNTAVEITHRLQAARFDVLLDDRDERPGVKFKDADLVGIPFRVTVGKKVTEGTVEVVHRSTHQVQDVSIAAIAEHFGALLPA